MNSNGLKNKTSNLNFEEVESLATELADFTCSYTSAGFYRKSILALGPGLVREAMGEVRMRENQGGIENRAKYLTTVLKNWMEERDLCETTSKGNEERVLSQTTFDLMTVALDTTTKIQNDPIKTMDIPFSPDLVQWLVFVGPEYFTVKNERAKSDYVKKTLVPIKGRFYEVPMIRGRLVPNGKERGILTAEHMRVKGAIERIWADKKGPHGQEGRLCVVRASVPEIARYLDIHTSGPDYKRISDVVHDLAATGYCYLLKENSDLKQMGLDDMSFKFFGEVQSVTVEKTTYFEITFSKVYSAALLSRDKVLVSRPSEMLQMQSAISLKLYLYLYRLLMGQHEGHSIELKNLIEILDLRIAGWHHYKSQRKREFEKAVKDIHGQPTHDGRIFSLQIIQGLNKADFLLEAHLKSL